MRAQVIGISGSPVKNSNTDRLVQAVLNSTGLATEFIKLSQHTIRGCMACMRCVNDNICKVKDDFPEVARKVRQAQALVVGGYPPYGSLDSFTKAFLERLFSLRHRHGCNQGKLAVTVVTGNGRGTPGIDMASAQIKTALTHEGMEVLGQLKVTGNLKCVRCSHGQTCSMSALPRLFGDDINTLPQTYCRVEDQKETWEQAQKLGREIATRLAGNRETT
ncbi:flavodoxin family protein [Desulfoplanes formicivorans]|uniref:NADPH-dependent FMN reductase n=1 Tax=Desulfoplanes formicivorans TaxID=1592317 RepID=A0A194ADV1_9BACT|nr:flavodoxin family protein [Desulfoplanes formicivorans]GAU07380.1 NADPH-dependent FMN reductase [Desulfoplanes formicivorans]